MSEKWSNLFETLLDRGNNKNKYRSHHFVIISPSQQSVCSVFMSEAFAMRCFFKQYA